MAQKETIESGRFTGWDVETTYSERDHGRHFVAQSVS
jgi:hypothetical protein